MTIELRARVNALRRQIEQSESAARETAHRIARAQATFEEYKYKEEKAPQQEQYIEKKEQSTNQIIDVVEHQAHLIEEVTVIAKLAEERAFKAERKALYAQREAMFSNVVALITMTVAVTIFINFTFN